MHQLGDKEQGREGWVCRLVNSCYNDVPDNHARSDPSNAMVKDVTMSEEV